METKFCSRCRGFVPFRRTPSGDCCIIHPRTRVKDSALKPFARFSRTLLARALREKPSRTGPIPAKFLG